MGEGGKEAQFADQEKSKDVRRSNMTAAKALADSVRTSLGPRGMDKMIRSQNGDVMITNDGATILKHMSVTHPAAKMFVDLAHAQDVEAGDGTTSVTVIAGSLLAGCHQLMNRGIHPTTIADAYRKAASKCEEILESVAQPVDLADRETLLRAAITSLNSKVVSNYSPLLAPMAVDAVLKIIDVDTADNVDLRNIRILKKLGGTVEDSELVADGMLFTQKISGSSSTVIKDAKVGLIQFCLSPPKSNLDNQVIVEDAAQIDRILREEQKYIVSMVQKIKKTGCNVLLIQKSILRDAVTDLSLHVLAKLKILVVKDIERDEIEVISRTLGCSPVASIESFTVDRLGRAGVVEQNQTPDGAVVKFTKVPNPGASVSVLLRGVNRLVIDESDRSLHDALCVIRSLVKKRFTIAGGGAPEIEMSMKLAEYSKTLSGLEAYCVRAFAEALEVIPYTLAENAGLNPIQTVTELRNRHANGETSAGINVRKGHVSNILEENVIQPLLVTSSAVTLAAETCAMILKIDDIVGAR